MKNIKNVILNFITNKTDSLWDVPEFATQHYPLIYLLSAGVVCLGFAYIVVYKFTE